MKERDPESIYTNSYLAFISPEDGGDVAQHSVRSIRSRRRVKWTLVRELQQDGSTTGRSQTLPPKYSQRAHLPQACLFLDISLPTSLKGLSETEVTTEQPLPFILIIQHLQKPFCLFCTSVISSIIPKTTNPQEFVTVAIFIVGCDDRVHTRFVKGDYMYRENSEPVILTDCVNFQRGLRVTGVGYHSQNAVLKI